MLALQSLTPLGCPQYCLYNCDHTFCFCSIIFIYWNGSVKHACTCVCVCAHACVFGHLVLTSNLKAAVGPTGISTWVTWWWRNVISGHRQQPSIGCQLGTSWWAWQQDYTVGPWPCGNTLCILWLSFLAGSPQTSLQACVVWKYFYTYQL